MTGEAGVTTGAATGGARHVLLIEDEANIAEAMRFILMRDGWRVTVHGEGVGALEHIRAAAPDLLILDLMLPGVSGLDVLMALRADPTLRALPVLMLTARGQARDREAAERAGANRFVTKPFSNAEILMLAREMVPV